MAKNWLSRLSLAAVIIGAAISTTSCSSDDDKDSGEWITPNNADVTVLYYSNGGGDLDASTEWDLVGAAYELSTDTRNVRLFVQHKYTGQQAYGKYIADERKKNPAFNYVMSGEPGSVYRFEMTWNMVNPQIADILQNFNYETAGIPILAGLEGCKIGGADFKMYKPGNLTDFIRWSMQQTPESKAYVLCIGNHGGGYSVNDDYDKKNLTKGILYDDNINAQYDQKVCMSPKEIAKALGGLSEQERSKLKILYFDACMMNNIEVLCELKGLVPYVIASAHSVTSGDQAILAKRMGQSGGNLEAMAKGAGVYIDELVNQKRKSYFEGGKKNSYLRNMDCTLTDMSKLDALTASVKAVREFLTSEANRAQLTEKKAAYEAAASQCYHFTRNAQFYDMTDYVNKLKANVFPESEEFARLAEGVKTAARAAMRHHADYSYAIDPVKGVNSHGISYSITLGCSTEALTFAPSLGSISTQGAIIVNPEGGSGTASDKYYCTVYLENGNAYFHEWLKGEAYDGKTFDKKSDYCASFKSWQETYCKTAFDRATGWSEWMRINPGVPVGNPPAGDGPSADWTIDN